MSCCPDKKNKPFTEYSLVKATRSVIKHFTNSTYDAFVDDEVKKMRMEACNGCDQLREVFGLKNCKVCDCFVDAKSSLVEMDCEHPDGSKWRREK